MLGKRCRSIKSEEDDLLYICSKTMNNKKNNINSFLFSLYLTNIGCQGWRICIKWISTITNEFAQT